MAWNGKKVWAELALLMRKMRHNIEAQAMDEELFENALVFFFFLMRSCCVCVVRRPQFWPCLYAAACVYEFGGKL